MSNYRNYLENLLYQLLLTKASEYNINLVMQMMRECDDAHI